MRNRWNAPITDQAFYNRSSFLSRFKSNHLARHPAVTCHFLDCSPHLINVTQISGSFRKYQWHRWISSIPIANSYKHLSYSWSALQLKPHSIPKSCVKLFLVSIEITDIQSKLVRIIVATQYLISKSMELFDLRCRERVNIEANIHIWFRILTTYLGAI